MTREVLPATGYEHMVVGNANALVTRTLAPALRDILQTGTLYAHAARTPGALVLQGRAPVYAVQLGPLTDRVAVRHVMRGGMVGRVLKDRFLPPTRVARELAAAFRLRMAGVPTPDVLAVVTYTSNRILRRADVVTRFVEGGADLAAVFGDERNNDQRHPILDAVARLLARLTAAGAQHPDLNLKNILITSAENGYVAHVLDVDRVHFHIPDDPLVARANLDRLLRSLRQWRARTAPGRSAFSDDDIAYLSLAATAQPA